MIALKVTAKAFRSGNWWAIEVPEVAGVFSQAKRLDQVAEMAADAVAVIKGVDPKSIEVTVIPDLPQAQLDVVEASRQMAKQAEESRFEALLLSRRAIKDLKASGLTVRDIGFMLGLSPQRISQLVPEESKQHPSKSTRANV
ncbi:hypothetical protein [Crystallibacter degradans]|uniref:hypothetical protein n=1 Tax=Crystallibacter degradans TaxID=2726743 RepID=UPI00147488D2|nr:hypothetical protein [Arthrobacter sp. SF27]NMR28100.1 hypothetical protein [Arthrobacter sp. SF27]